MTNDEIVRSWKDDDYRLSLNSGELAFMPCNPAGLIELTDEELFGVEGGLTPSFVVASFLLSAATAVIVTEVTHHICTWARCH
jgi:mersacidin/lichenicidin family type 2 lantibiotic